MSDKQKAAVHRTVATERFLQLRFRRHQTDNPGNDPTHLLMCKDSLAELLREKAPGGVEDTRHGAIWRGLPVIVTAEPMTPVFIVVNPQHD